MNGIDGTYTDMTVTVTSNNLESLTASGIAYYAGYPAECCAIRLRLEQTSATLSRMRGIIFQHLLSRAAQAGHKHINWQKPHPVKQAEPYLKSDASKFLETFSFVPLALVIFLGPLGVVYSVITAPTFFWLLIYSLVGTFVGMMIGTIFSAPSKGLLKAETLSLDNQDCYSLKYNIVGRPDRIIRIGKYIIPEEWKSHHRPDITDIVQLGAYLILTEEHYGVRPPYGILMMGNGNRYKIRNTEQLRNKVLSTAQEFRSVLHHLSASNNLPA